MLYQHTIGKYNQSNITGGLIKKNVEYVTFFMKNAFPVARTTPKRWLGYDKQIVLSDWYSF